MPEQFAFQQGFGNRRATDFHQRPVAPVAQVMQRIGGDLFAGTTFTLNEHVDIGGRNLADEVP